jgi:phosphatidylserine decarboxylase
VFRDPARTIPAAPLGIVSPIDGRVVDLREGHDELLDRAAVVVRIQQSWGAILTWRYPIEGRIMKIWWNDRPKNPESRNKPFYSVHIRTDEKDDVLTSFGRTAWGINSFDCQPGDRVAQGGRAGYAGIRRWVEVSLPAQSRIDIELGASVKGGADVIATLVH